jgi:hypothetical protein
MRSLWRDPVSQPPAPGWLRRMVGHLSGLSMHAFNRHRASLATLALIGCGSGWAQTAPAASPAASASASASAAASHQQRVLEDDNVRIEETRQRGQVQRIRVQSKLPGVRDYDITTSPGGKDLSQNPGTVGKRSWSILDF